MMSSPRVWIPLARSSASGASVSRWHGCPVCRSNPAAGGPPAFPPSVVIQVKALACELPYRLGLPLSRFSISEIQREVLAQGIVADISGTTLWRWLSADEDLALDFRDREPRKR